MMTNHRDHLPSQPQPAQSEGATPPGRTPAIVYTLAGKILKKRESVMTEEDLQQDLEDDLIEFLNESPEDRYQAVQNKLEALTKHFHTDSLRIDEEIFNLGLETITNGIMIIYCSLHEEH